MDWRCATVLTLVIPAFAQVPDIPLTRLKPDATIAIDLERGALVTPGAVWIPQRNARTVVRVDAKNASPGGPVALPAHPCASMVLVDTVIWTATCDESALTRIDEARGNVSAAVPLPIAEPAGSLAVAAHSVWVITDTKGIVTRVDHETHTPVAEVYVARHPFALAATAEAVWVTSEGGLVTRIDARTNVIVETVKVGPRPGPVAVGEGAVWVVNRGDGSITRIDSETNKVSETIKVGEAVAEAAIAVGEGAVWLSARGMPLVRIDPRTNRVTHRFVGPAGGAVVVGHGSVWISAGPNTTWRLDPQLVAAMRPH